MFPLLESFLFFITPSPLASSVFPVSFSGLFFKGFVNSSKVCLFEDRFVAQDNSIPSFLPGAFPVSRLFRKVTDKFLNNSPESSTSVSPPWHLSINDNFKYFPGSLFFCFPPVLFWCWQIFPQCIAFHCCKGHPPKRFAIPIQSMSIMGLRDSSASKKDLKSIKKPTMPLPARQEAQEDLF